MMTHRPGNPRISRRDVAKYIASAAASIALGGESALRAAPPAAATPAAPATQKDDTMTYRRLRVTDRDGRVDAITPLPDAKLPHWAARVRQEIASWPAPAKSAIFESPIPFVIPPPKESGEPFYSHNHCPSITWLPNGDLLAVWFSTIREEGVEMTIVASRLRAGHEAWDSASEFFKAADRNMTSCSIFYDEHANVLHHLNGVGREGVEGWRDQALLHRCSRDNGVTWSAAHVVSPGGRYQSGNKPVAGMMRTRDGALLQTCDRTDKGEGDSTVHVSGDGGDTWQDAGGHIRGIHARVTELADGRWLAFGRGRDMDGRMPQSVSNDRGKTWQYSASRFPPIGAAQRLVLMRLREGPLLFVSFTGVGPDAAAMTFTGADGKEFEGRGLFAAVSDDDGASWPVQQLITPGKGACEVGPYFGAKVKRQPVVKTTPTQAENEGYLAATQTPDGVIHLISSRLHYRFNLASLVADAMSQP